MNCNAFYVTKLKEELVERQKKNPAYSLRSYADYLGIHPGTLSSVFNGKRTLPMAAAERIVAKLNLSPQQKLTFLKSLATEKARFRYLSEEQKEKQIMLDETHYKVIAQWEHYALIALTETKEFRSDVEWMSQRLGLSVNQIQVALDRLVQSGLIERDETGCYRKTFSNLKTSEDVLSPALQKAHLEELDLAKDKLQNVPVTKRDFSSTTFAINPKQMEKAKMAIYEFRQKMHSIMEEGDQSEVYQLCIQLFPLTTVTNDNKDAGVSNAPASLQEEILVQ